MVTRVRILFTGFSAIGHLFPLLPLARAFRRRGDDVAVMVPATMVPLFAEEDMELLVAGADIPTIRAEVLRRTGIDMSRNATRDGAIEVFCTCRLDLSAEVALSVTRSWRPDLIVHDVMDFLGSFVAAAHDLPAAAHTFGPDVSGDFIAQAATRATVDFETRGVRWRPARWVVDICPPLLQVDGWQTPHGWLPLRPQAHSTPDASPPTKAKPLAGHPRLLVTFGTIFTRPTVLSPLVRELAATGASIRVTTGITASPADFDVDHDAVTFEGFQPYEELLRDIDVVVAHGGAGTNLGALAAGLPLVLVPQGADQGAQAERAVAAGAAIRIPHQESSPRAVADAVAEVLTHPGYRAGARHIAEQIATMPSPDDMAARLAAAVA
jgi:UDP:flavonoid glycosyltransferase YjiC (YdhE family)